MPSRSSWEARQARQFFEARRVRHFMGSAGRAGASGAWAIQVRGCASAPFCGLGSRFCVFGVVWVPDVSLGWLFWFCWAKFAWGYFLSGGRGGRRWGMCIWIGAVAKFQHWLAILSGGLLLCGGWGSGLCYWVLQVRVGLWLFAGWFCIIILCSFYIFLNFLGFPSLKLFDNWWSSWYIPVITNNHASFHLWWKENLLKHRKVSGYYELDRVSYFGWNLLYLSKKNNLD